MAGKSKKPGKKPAAKRPAAKRRNRTVIKAKRVTVVSANPKRRRRNVFRISPEDIKKFPPHMQAQYWAHWNNLEASEERAATPAQQKRVESKKRSFLSRMRTRLNVLRKAKKFKVSARDMARCPLKVIKVRATSADNALAHAKRKLGSRYAQFRVQNAVRVKGRNPTYTVEAIPKYTRTVREDVKALTRGSAIRKVRKAVPGPKHIYSYRVEKNPKRNGAIEEVGKFVTGTAKRTLKATGRALTGVGKVLSNPRRKKRNQAGAEGRREAFAGNVTGYKDLWFPEGTPAGLSTLGPLVAIKMEAGTMKPHLSGAYLCQDARGHLHIGSSRQVPLWNGPAESFGKVKRVEYTSAKPHLGEAKTVTWYHDFESPLPELRADGKGGIRFVGGGYTIRREGIVG